MISSAVIGLGVGEKHVETLNKISFIKEVKVFDLNYLKAKKIVKKYKKAKICNSFKDIYNDKNIKLVCIASYDGDHFQQIVKLLKKNKNVFVEKPAVIYRNQAKIISNLLKKSNLYFGSNYILRKSKRFIKLRKLINKNYFGKIYAIEADYNYGRLFKILKGWRGREKKYSVTLGGGIHVIDLIIFLMNDFPRSVYSEKNKIVTKNTNFKDPDDLTSILKFKNQCILKITSNFGCVYPHFHKLNIYGSKKTFENYYDYGKVFYKRDNKCFKKIDLPYKKFSKGDLLKDFVFDFKNKLNRNKYISDVFKTLSVCFSIEDSLKTKKKIDIKFIK